MVESHEARPNTVLYDAVGRPIPRSSGRTGEYGTAVCSCGAVSTTLSPLERAGWIETHRDAISWETRNGWRDADGDPIGPLQPPTV